MHNTNKTKAQLLAEVTELRQRLADLESPGSERQHVDGSPPLQNADLEARAQELEARNRHLQSLNELGAALMAGMSLQEILDAVTLRVAEIVGGAVAGILLPDTEGVLRVRSSHGVAPDHFHDMAIRPNPLSRNWIAFETGQPLIVNDPAQTLSRVEEHQRALNDLTLRNFISIPLRARSHSIGLLIVLNKANDADFTQADTDLLVAFTAQAAVAIENTQLLEAAQHRAAELDALLQASLGLTASLELGDVLGEIVESVFKLLHRPRDVNIFLYGDDRLTFGAALGADGRKNRPHSEPRPGGMTYTVARQGQPMIVPDMREHPLFADRSDWQGAIVGLPLKIGSRVVGVMNFSYPERHAFSEADLRALRLLADQAAIAIENARLFEAERLQLRRQAALFRLSAEIAATPDETEICRRVVKGLHDDALGYDQVSIFLVDEATAERVLRASAGWAEAPSDLRIPPGQGVSEIAILYGQLHYTPDVTRNPRCVSGLNTGSEVDVPMRIGDKAAGVLVIESTRTGAFNMDDFEVLLAAASQAGIALGRARLLAAERRRADELEAVRATLADISGELELPKVLQAVLERAVALLGVTGGDLAIYDDKETELVVVSSFNLEQDYTGTHIAIGEGAAGCVAQTREPLIIYDYQHWDARSPHDAGAAVQWSSILSAPLVVGGRLVGVISIVNANPARRLGPDDLHLLKLFTPQAAIAIENARLYAAAQQEKQYFEALVLNSPIAVVTLDFDRRIVACNPAFEKLFGYSQAEVRDRQLDDLITTDATHTEALLYTRQAIFSPVHGIGQRRRKDGTLVDVELFGVPVFVDGERVGLLGLYHDITDLVRARREAEAANRSKSQFLANMSHELRTPLNAILGYSEMLQEEARDIGSGASHFVADLQRIYTAGKHLLALINDILDLSKIEAGKIDLYLETFDVEHLVQDAVTTVQPLVQKQANTLVVRYGAGLGVMHADQTKVRQSLFNLLSNAGKFTERGTITLDVARHTMSGVDWIIFRIGDTGIGMSPDQINRLFEPFTQADASTTRKYGGTGLGLTITKRFCQMMGGDIDVESALGHGSTFTIRLPVQVVDPNSVPPSSGDTHLERLRAGMTTVLVVDDDLVMRDLMQRFLDREGFQVVGAASAEEGLRLARQIHPDAITLDVTLTSSPNSEAAWGPDGWAVLSMLKADPDCADIPVVMVTIVDDKKRGYALGASDYLTKPIDRDRLVSILEKYRCARPGCSILIVEDDVPTREVMRRLLEKEGWTVAEAENGRTALDQVAASHPELILLDLMMPEMDGFEFITKLRKRPDWRATPVIVVTAKDLTVEDRLQLNGYVEKIIHKGAYSQDDLLREVKELVVACVGRTPVLKGSVA